MNCLTVFNELEKWINRRPGLDLRDYGLYPGMPISEWKNARRCYDQEARAIAKDGREARAALKEARMQPPHPELMQDAFRAFSGRLTWCEKHHHDAKTGKYEGQLNYCTGQYWPTEYRKAAKAVLESYISAVKQHRASENSLTHSYQTIQDVRAASQAAGQHWFDRSTMRFFNTKIVSPLIAGRYFVTSEFHNIGDQRRPTLFTIREAKPDASIDTVGEFQQYSTRAGAMQAVRALVTSAGGAA